MKRILILSLVFIQGCMTTEAVTHCGYFKWNAFMTDTSSEELRTVVDKECAHSVEMKKPVVNESKGGGEITKGAVQGLTEGIKLIK